MKYHYRLLPTFTMEGNAKFHLEILVQRFLHLSTEILQVPASETCITSLYERLWGSIQSSELILMNYCGPTKELETTRPTQPKSVLDKTGDRELAGGSCPLCSHIAFPHVTWKARPMCCLRFALHRMNQIRAA